MSCWSERWWPPGSRSRRLGSWAAANSCSLTVYGTCSSPRAWRSSSAVSGPSSADGLVEVERAQPGLGGLHVAAEALRPVRPQRAHEQVLRRRADRHHGAERRVAGRGVDGREAAHARSAQRNPRARAPGAAPPSPARRPRRPGPNSPSERPWPRASKASAAMPSSRHPRAKSKWLSFADPAPWRTTTPASGSPSGRNSA